MLKICSCTEHLYLYPHVILSFWGVHNVQHCTGGSQLLRCVPCWKIQALFLSPLSFLSLSLGYIWWCPKSTVPKIHSIILSWRSKTKKKRKKKNLQTLASTSQTSSLPGVSSQMCRRVNSNVWNVTSTCYKSEWPINGWKEKKRNEGKSSEVSCRPKRIIFKWSNTYRWVINLGQNLNNWVEKHKE